MAALSVVYFNGGIKTSQFSETFFSVSTFLIREFAETPPPIAILLIPNDFFARLIF